MRTVDSGRHCNTTLGNAGDTIDAVEKGLRSGNCRLATPEMLAQHEGQPLTADDEPVVEAHKYDWAHIDQDEDKKHTVAELRKWHLKEFEEKKPELSKAEREKRVDELVEFLLTKDSDGDGLLTHEEVTGKKHHTEL